MCDTYTHTDTHSPHTWSMSRFECACLQSNLDDGRFLLARTPQINLDCSQQLQVCKVRVWHHIKHA